MALTPAFIFGQDIVLYLVVVMATIGTFGAMAAIVFFALAPHFSEEWAREFDHGSTPPTTREAPREDQA